MKHKLEEFAKQIDKWVNTKIKKSDLDITQSLQSIKDNIILIKGNITHYDEVKYSNYLIQKCDDFSKSVERVGFKF